MLYWVVDAETSIKNRGEGAVGDMKASPYCTDNKIVLFGERQNKKNTLWNKSVPNCLVAASDQCVLLIGSNISFDLKYMQKTWPEVWQQVINNIYIWDIQQVKYLLSGQTHMYPSLDQMCEELGRPVKDDRMKEYWENDVDTEMIPSEIIEPYLHHDLEETEAVFRHQYAIVSKDEALFNLVKVKMDDILCTTMMENNGMQFDLVEANLLANNNDMRIDMWTHACKAVVSDMFIPSFEFNPMSNDHVSLALFGGEYKMKEAVPALDKEGNLQYYKSGAKKGELKTRLEDVVYKTEGMGLTPPAKSVPKKTIHSVADDVLKNYSSLPFAGYIQSIREATKENETYYRGFSSQVWPDSKIHASFGHCGTRTGRNNHSKPNLGNVTRD